MKLPDDHPTESNTRAQVVRCAYCAVELPGHEDGQGLYICADERCREQACHEARRDRPGYVVPVLYPVCTGDAMRAFDELLHVAIDRHTTFDSIGVGAVVADLTATLAERICELTGAEPRRAHRALIGYATVDHPRAALFAIRDVANDRYPDHPWGVDDDDQRATFVAELVARGADVATL